MKNLKTIVLAGLIFVGVTGCQKDYYLADLEEAQAEIELLKKSVNDLNNRFDNAQNHISQLTASNSNLQNQIANLQSELTQLQSDYDNAVIDLETANELIEELEAKIKFLESELGFVLQEGGAAEKQSFIFDGREFKKFQTKDGVYSYDNREGVVRRVIDLQYTAGNVSGVVHTLAAESGTEYTELININSNDSTEVILSNLSNFFNIVENISDDMLYWFPEYSLDAYDGHEYSLGDETYDSFWQPKGVEITSSTHPKMQTPDNWKNEDGEWVIFFIKGNWTTENRVVEIKIQTEFDEATVTVIQNPGSGFYTRYPELTQNPFDINEYINVFRVEAKARGIDAERIINQLDVSWHRNVPYGGKGKFCEYGNTTIRINLDAWENVLWFRPDRNWKLMMLIHEIGHSYFEYRHPEIGGGGDTDNENVDIGYNGHKDIMGYSDFVWNVENGEWDAALDRFFAGTGHEFSGCSQGKGSRIITCSVYKSHIEHPNK